MSLQRFEGPTIEAVLEEARAAMGPGVRIVEANRLRKGGLGGFFAKERFEVAVEAPNDDDAPTTMPTSVPMSTPIPVRPTAGDPVLALADAVSDGELASSLSTEQSAFAELLGRMARDAGDDDELPPAAVVPVRQVSAPAVAARPPSGDATLARLGLPMGMVPSGGDDTMALIEALRALPVPAPVPAAPGDVVAMVGPRDAALALARSIAAELGLSDDDVSLAAEDDDGDGVALGCLLPTVPAVIDERCSARWRRRPTVVAVATGVRATGSSFGRRALEALEPSATWGAVPAMCKPEDVLAWSDSLGGLDAIALDGLDDTTTPASILGTGIPVARLDGRPASAALWTALLLERLAA